MAAGYSGVDCLRHTFAVGRQKDCDELVSYLSNKYDGQAVLCKNGRSALALALMAYFEPGDAVIINGFTCYAVYEAVKAAKLKPVFADISKESLNYTLESLEDVMADSSVVSKKNQDADFSGKGSYPDAVGKKPKGIIIQNTLGNPVDIVEIEKFAKKHDLMMIEDLAHCAGVRYRDGREVGTVGVAVAFSFGKDKSIDTVSGGALVLRDPCKKDIKAPSESPKVSEHLRARFYPLFGAICRGLTYVKLGGALMRLLVKIHFVERSADNRLDMTQRISKFEAKLALRQFKGLKKTGELPIRGFNLVRDRSEVLAKLRKAGYYFDGLWYEKPVSPERYYKKVHFPEAKCPVAVEVAEQIVNTPCYYSKKDLIGANKIISEYKEENE